ncbi:hypothetical protein Tco_0269639 [Tanacetum coccineum]
MIVTTSRTMPNWGGGRGKLVVVYAGLIVILSLACGKGFAFSSTFTVNGDDEFNQTIQVRETVTSINMLLEAFVISRSGFLLG